MPQGYYARKCTLQTGENKGKVVYTASPFYFGTLTTDDMAEQIATESAMTKGDVKNVMEGIQRYIRTNMAKGYRIELLGLGVIFNRFTTAPAVSTAKEVTAKLIKAIVPGFRGEFTRSNGSYRYTLLGEHTQLQRISFNGGIAEGDSETEDLDNVIPDPDKGGDNSDGDDDGFGGLG